jgi:excisionase family DNA binding protein
MASKVPGQGAGEVSKVDPIAASSGVMSVRYVMKLVRLLNSVYGDGPVITGIPMSTEMPLREVMTPAEAATIFQLPVKTVVALCARGDVPGAVKMGRRWRIPATAINDFFRKRGSDAGLQEAKFVEAPKADRGSVAGHRGARREASRADILGDSPGRGELRGAGEAEVGGDEPRRAARRADFLRVL